MAIVSKPAAVNLCGNLPEFVLTANAPVNFLLYHGSTLILDEQYFPDADGIIRVDLEEVIDGLLSIKVPGSGVNVFHQASGQKLFKAVINGSEELFTVLKGGVDVLNLNTAAFLSSSFLTWQPQTKTVRLSDPQWLSYYAAAQSTLKAKAYLVDSSVQTITIAALPAGQLSTVNVTYSRLAALFSSQPYSIDVWVDLADTAKSYVQRYILSEEMLEFPDSFVFENSLGGLDTICFTGGIEHNQTFALSRGLFDDITKEYQVDPDQTFTKETGYFRSDQERLWSLDFFKSLQKYHVSGGLLKSIVVPKQTLESTPGDLNGYSFTFAHAKQTKYLQLERAELPTVINEHKLIHYGPALAIPTTAEDVLDLPFSLPDTQLNFTIDTGLTKIVVIAIPSTMSLESAFDDTSKERLTGSYKLIRTILVDGINYKIHAMKNIGAYTYNHEHLMVIKNG